MVLASLRDDKFRETILSIGPRLILFIRLLFGLMLSQQVIAGNPILRVAVLDDFPPFYYQDADGNYQGVSYEIASHVFNKLGYQLEITQLANMRLLLKSLKDGHQDVSFNLSTSEERLEVAVFTQTPHVFEAQNLIVRADSTAQFNGDLKTLKEYRFGPIYGWTYGPSFDSASYLQKEYVNESSQQLKELLAGRYDIALNNPLYFQRIASSMGVSNAFRILQPAVFTLPVTMAVSKQYPQADVLINAVERELVSFVKTETYQNILSRYGFNTPAPLMEQTP